jgi:hypothetical protein
MHGPLMVFFFDKYGYRVIYDSKSKIGTKLSSVIKDMDWSWLPAISEDLVSIQTACLLFSLASLKAC